MRRRMVVACCILLMLTPGLVSAGIKEDYEQACKIYVAAGACVAAYSDRYGQLANKYLERDGWQIERFEHGGDTVDARFLLARKQFADGRQMYVLAFVGTENNKDMKANLKVKKVYFAGGSLEEFAANASKQEVPAIMPKVHRGFHEFVQAGLAASTQDADGNARYLADVFRKNRDRKVILAGHSSGGAAATITGARLVSLGVKPEQIEIISFGAPSVGNDAFAAMFDPVLDLTRVVVSGDPVTGILQTLVGGYKQFGREILWEIPSVAHSPHAMATYADLAIKNYYDKREQAVRAGLTTLPRVAAIPGMPWGRVYIASIQNHLPSALSAEFRYIKQSLLDEYRNVIPSYVIGDDADNNLLLKKAAEAGCQWLLVPDVDGYRLKTEQNVYYITLAQAAYHVETGKLVKAAAFSSGTYYLTPLTAFMHVNKSMAIDWITDQTTLMQ